MARRLQLITGPVHVRGTKLLQFVSRCASLRNMFYIKHSSGGHKETGQEGKALVERLKERPTLVGEVND